MLQVSHGGISLHRTDGERLEHVADGAAGRSDTDSSAVVLIEKVLPRAAAPAGLEQPPAETLVWGKPQFDLDPEKEDRGPDARVGGIKIGGHPTWVQCADSPTCDVCKKPMRFIAQLDGGETGMNFGDIGMGYVFFCEEEHQGKLVVQSS